MLVSIVNYDIRIGIRTCFFPHLNQVRLFLYAFCPHLNADKMRTENTDIKCQKAHTSTLYVHTFFNYRFHGLVWPYNIMHQTTGSFQNICSFLCQYWPSHTAPNAKKGYEGYDRLGLGPIPVNLWFYSRCTSHSCQHPNPIWRGRRCLLWSPLIQLGKAIWLSRQTPEALPDVAKRCYNLMEEIKVNLIHTWRYSAVVR